MRIKETIDFAIDVICEFMEIALPSIRKTCGLIPRNYGLSVGIDAGECLLTELKSSTQYKERYGPKKGNQEPIKVSDNLTMLGRPVIGATRMVDAAEPYEILVNCYPGSALKAKIDDPSEYKIHENLYFGLDLDFRNVPEYCYGPVEVYRVTTDRIEHLKRELGLVEEDEEASEEIKEEPNSAICKPTKPKQKRTK